MRLCTNYFYLFIIIMYATQILHAFENNLSLSGSLTFSLNNVYNAVTNADIHNRESSLVNKFVRALANSSGNDDLTRQKLCLSNNGVCNDVYKDNLKIEKKRSQDVYESLRAFNRRPFELNKIDVNNTNAALDRTKKTITFALTEIPTYANPQNNESPLFTLKELLVNHEVVPLWILNAVVQAACCKEENILEKINQPRDTPTHLKEIKNKIEELHMLLKNVDLGQLIQYSNLYPECLPKKK